MADAALITFIIQGLLSAMGNEYIVGGYFGIALLLGFMVATDMPMLPSMIFSSVGFVLAVVAGTYTLLWVYGLLIFLVAFMLFIGILRLVNK